MTKQEAISEHIKGIMQLLELDLSDDSLIGTPDRIAKLYVNEIFSGLDKATYPKITAVENKFNMDEMVTVKDITVNSMCEHHFLPFFGKAKISYIPEKKILGLSKFNRIVDYYSRRPQIQERLTNDILKDLQKILETDNIAIEIEAVHTCVMIRGIKDSTSKTKTVALGGVFKQDHSTRTEFLRG
jgi:GTP cyclohydrolase I